MRSNSKKKYNSGWLLLETVVTTALLGLVIILVVSMLQSIKHQEKINDPVAMLTSAQLALTGYALAHQRFPEPDAAIDSPNRPGYREGWLPAASLGLSHDSNRLRYLVNSSLVNSADIYDADPMNLAEGKIIRRERPANIDFCASLLQKELEKYVRPNKFRTAFALQKADRAEGGAPVPLSHIWLKDAAQEDLPPSVILHTIQRGFTEIAVQLRCFELLDRTVSNVKTVGALTDMSRLANQEVLRNDLSLRQAENSITGAAWRTAHWVAGTAVGAVRLEFAGFELAAAMDTEEGPDLNNYIELVNIPLAIAGTTAFGINSAISLDAAIAALPGVRAGLATAQAYAEKIDGELAIYVNAANKAQAEGGVDE